MPGHLIYRGPSLIDGSAIIVVAITSTRKDEHNLKTGEVVQTYIMREDMSPIRASQAGQDIGICGTCKHRGVSTKLAKRSKRGATHKAKGRTCYVNLGQGPTIVYKHYMLGSYGTDAAEGLAMASLECDGRKVRLGTYGDPAAVPMYIWLSLLESAAGHLGYSHQTDSGLALEMQGLVMASADSAEHAKALQALGYRTFRVRLPGEAKLENESVCPASEEAGRKLTCSGCGMCAGSDGKKSSIVIFLHGIGAKGAAQRAAI